MKWNMPLSRVGLGIVESLAVGPDLVQYTIRGSHVSVRISDWHHFSVSNGREWEPRLTDLVNLDDLDNKRQLANAAAAVAGEPHTMPDFADALSVQVLVEGMLGDSPDSHNRPTNRSTGSG